MIPAVRHAVAGPLLMGMLASVLPAQTTALLKGSDPRPADATRAIIAAFDTFQIVAMSAGHRVKDLDDFIYGLVRNPAFPNAVNDVVIEEAISLYQPVLDRYVAGEDLPFSDVQRAWRNAQPPGISAYGEQIVPLIRRINQKLPPAKRLRVLASEPGIDWNLLKTTAEAQAFLGGRDSNMAHVIAQEVLAKHRKALVLLGEGHLGHGLTRQGWGLAVALYEKTYPGVSLVVAVHGMNACDARVAGSPAYKAIEARMTSWPVPSLARIQGTWLTALDNIYSNVLRARPWSESYDAYLYLGPSDLLLYEPSPAHVWLDQPYMDELHRRAAIPVAASDRAKAQLDAEKVRAREGKVLFCDVENSSG